MSVTPGPEAAPDPEAPDPAAGRVLDAAIAVARQAPARRGTDVSAALIYWPVIEELRAALDALGIEWRLT